MTEQVHDYNEFVAIVVNEEVTHVLGVSPDLYAALDSKPIVVTLGNNPLNIIPGQVYDANTKMFSNQLTPNN